MGATRPSPTPESFGSDDAPSEQSEQTGAAVELHRLARDLHLTEMQRRFVEALAADTDRSATRAALAAGAGKGAAVTASKWLKLAKVRRYFEAVVAAAVPGGLDETNRRVMSLQEALAIRMAQARGEAPTRVCRTETPVAGGGSKTRVTETYDALGACCDLLDHYQPAGSVGHVEGTPGYKATHEVLLLLSGMAEGLIPGCVTDSVDGDTTPLARRASRSERRQDFAGPARPPPSTPAHTARSVVVEATRGTRTT